MIVRPIFFTSHEDRWLDLCRALGGTVATENPGWTVVDLGRGRLAIHHAEPGDELDGTITMAFEVDNAPEFTESLGLEQEQKALIEEGRCVEIYHPALPRFTIDTKESDARPSGHVMVAPLFVTPDVPSAMEFVSRLGIPLRARANSGDYVDYASADGAFAIHIGDETGTTPGFETDNLDSLIKPLHDAGFRATIVDENFGRTLRVENPDDSSHDAEIWICETQSDFHGYSRGE